MALLSGRGFVLLFFTIPILVVVLNSIIAVWLSTSVQKYRGVPWFVAMLLAGVGWGVITVLQAVSPAIGAVTAIQSLSFFVIGTGFWCFAVFLSKYTGLEFHRHPLAVAASLLAVPGHLLVIVTDPFHHRYMAELTHVTEPVSYVAYQPGAAFLVPIIPLAVFVAYSEIALVRTLLSTDGRNGVQIALVLVGMLSSGLVQLIGNLGVFPAPGFAYGSWGLLPFVACFTIALFWTDFLDVQPVARSAVVENLRDPVVVLDGDRRVIDYNDASQRLWPDIARQVGTQFGEAFPSLAEELTLAETDGETAQQVTMTVDGTTRYFSVNTARVTRGGTDDHALVSILLRDVTELERSRSRLRKQNEQLDKVASTISHDLRNPITVADGNAKLAQDLADEDGVDPADAEEVLASLATIRDKHDRMLDIIGDILTIAREGKTVEETEPVDLAAVAREAWANVDTGAASLSVADDHRVQADRSKLLTIFENLFRNSVEHAADDGDVTVTVGATEDGFAVADDGPGIPAEHRADLFEYGYTTTAEGTGLGLSIVETMADSHGWTVELDETADGARFVFGNVTRAAPSEPEVDPVLGT